jgi:hypothetical protein
MTSQMMKYTMMQAGSIHRVIYIISPSDQRQTP